MRNSRVKQQLPSVSPVDYRFKAMGGEFQLFSYLKSYSNEKAEKIFALVEKEVIRIENKFTDFRESPFQMINEKAGRERVFVDEEIFNLVKRSLDFSIKTNGIFDISFASVGHLWREAKRSNKRLGYLDRIVASRLIDYKKIELDENNLSIFLPHPKMRISLGGIGKGYAIDRAYKILKEFGFANFYVNGAGDIRVHSEANAPRKWRFGIQNPLAHDFDKKIGVIQISQGSISSSGGYAARNNLNGDTRDHHIISPRSGISNRKVIATTVYTPTAIESDVYATSLMNMKPDEGLSFMEKEQLAGMIVTDEGRCLLSKKALKNFGI